MINTLRTVMDKVDNGEEPIGNISREMKILIKNQKDMLEIKNTVIDMEHTFVGIISTLDTAKKRINELEVMSIETCKIEMQKE